MNNQIRVFIVVFLSAVWILTDQAFSSPNVTVNEVYKVRSVAHATSISSGKLDDGDDKVPTYPSSVEVASADYVRSRRLETEASGKSIRGIQIDDVDYYQEPLMENTSLEEKISNDVSKDLLKRSYVHNNDIASEHSASLKPVKLKLEAYTNHQTHSITYSKSDLDDISETLHQNDVIHSVEVSDSSGENKRPEHPRKPVKHSSGGARRTSRLRDGLWLTSAVTPKYIVGDHENENKFGNASQFFRNETSKLLTRNPVTNNIVTDENKAVAFADVTTDYRCSHNDADAATVIPRVSVVGQVGEPINVSCQLNPACISESSVANITVMERDRITPRRDVMVLEKISAQFRQFSPHSREKLPVTQRNFPGATLPRISFTQRSNIFVKYPAHRRKQSPISAHDEDFRASYTQHSSYKSSPNQLETRLEYKANNIMEPAAHFGTRRQKREARAHECKMASYFEVGLPLEIPNMSQVAGNPPSLNCSVFNRGEVVEHFLVPPELESNTSQSLSFMMQQPGTYMLKCQDIANDNISCYRSLFVGSPPMDVLNFDCICHDYGNLECWFDAPDNPAQLNLQNYTICIVRNDDCDTLSPERKKGGKRQLWNFTEVPISPLQLSNLTFNISAHNQLGSSFFLHTINYYTRVQLDGATDVVAHQINLLVYSLEWNERYYRLKYDVIARVNITSTYWSESRLVRGTTTFLRLRHHFVSYNVTVELQPYVPGARYWSRARTVDIQTLAATPPVPPLTAPGMFEIVDSSPELFSVILCWLPVPRELQAGPHFGYLVQVARRTTNCSDCQDFVQPFTPDNYIVFNNLSRSESYSFRVYSVNNCSNTNRSQISQITAACRSNESAAYFYSEVDETVPSPPAFPTTLYSKNNLVSLRWYPRDDHPTNFTLYYCTNDEKPCKNGVRFLPLHGLTSVNISLNRSSRSTDTLRHLQEFTGYREGDELQTSLRFAVSADRNVGDTVVSSGMVWARCPKVRFAQDSTSPPLLELLNKTSHSVLLSWKWKSEKDCPPPSVVAMQILTCPLHSLTCTLHSSQDWMDVPVWEKTFLLNNLKSSSRYTTRLKILYDDGRGPVYSEPLLFITRPKVLLWWQVALIVSGTLLALGIIVFVFQFSHRSLKEAMEPLPVPDFQRDSSSITFSRKSAHTGKHGLNQQTSTAPERSFQRPVPEATSNKEKHSLLNPPKTDRDVVGTLNFSCEPDTSRKDASTAPIEEGLLEEQTVLLGAHEETLEALPYTTLEFVSADDDERNPSPSLVEVKEESEVGQNLNLEINNFGYVLAQLGSQSSSTHEDKARLHSQCTPYVAIGTPFSTWSRLPSSSIGLDQNSLGAAQHQESAPINYLKTEASPYVFPSFATSKEQNLDESETRKNLYLYTDAKLMNENKDTGQFVSNNLNQMKINPYVKLTSLTQGTYEGIPASSLNLKQIWSSSSNEVCTSGILSPDHSSYTTCKASPAVLPYIPNKKIFSFNFADIDQSKTFTSNTPNFASVGSYEVDTPTSFPQKTSEAPNVITGLNIPGHGHLTFLTDRAYEQQTEALNFDGTTYDEGLGYSPTAKEIEEHPYVTSASLPHQKGSNSADLETGNNSGNRHRTHTQSSRVSDLGVVSDFEVGSDDDLNPDLSPDIYSVQMSLFSDYSFIGVNSIPSTGQSNEHYQTLENPVFSHSRHLSDTPMKLNNHETNLNSPLKFSNENLTKILAPLHSKMSKKNPGMPCALALSNGTVTIYPKVEE
ncbi:Fibronectin type III [Trinorchestia longiramus]|nr:Fibronectin type III [Trinorchestia longiramus]